MSKLSAAEGKAAEPIPGLDFAVSCNYLDTNEHERLRNEYRKSRAGLITMMRNPDPLCGPSTRGEPDEDYELDEDDDLLGEF